MEANGSAKGATRDKLGADDELEAIDAPLVLAFLKHLEEPRGCSASTRNARLARDPLLQRYAELCVPSIIEQSRRVLAIPMKRTDTKLVRHLSQPEMEAVLGAPDMKQRDDIRDRAMLHLAFAAGLRRRSIVSGVTRPPSWFRTRSALRRKPAALVVGEPQATVPELLAQDAVLL